MSEKVKPRRPRSTIIPGRIIIPRLVMAEAGFHDNASYLDEPSARSEESRGSRNEGMMDDFDAPENPEGMMNREVEEVTDEEPPVEFDVSMAVQNRPTRNRRAPLRWWLLERPVYNRERGFVGISKGSTSNSDSEVSRKKKSKKAGRKRNKKNETPAGKKNETKKKVKK